LTGKLSDGCGSIVQNAGLVYTEQNSNADSGRCGQAFNGSLYGGLSNKQYGMLTIGRQNSLQLDGIAAYDPMVLSYAFSLLGYSGTNGGSGRPAGIIRPNTSTTTVPSPPASCTPTVAPTPACSETAMA
jgi:hypothetical protein